MADPNFLTYKYQASFTDFLTEIYVTAWSSCLEGYCLQTAIFS